MLSQNKHTAILLFTNNVIVEAKRKLFVSDKNKKSNIEIASALIATTESKIKNTQLPYFIVSTEQQIGNNFGERLANAIDFVFNKGFDNIIVLGNDCPQVTTKYILEAIRMFKNNQLIVGPTLKGGSYLIGLTKESFHKTQFENLAWESKGLLKDLIIYSKSNALKTILGCYFSDINNKSDLKDVLSKLDFQNSFIKALVSIKIKFNLFFKPIRFVFKKKTFLFFFTSKAPPLVLN